MPNLRTCRKRASRLVKRASPHVCSYINLPYLFQTYWNIKYLGKWVTALFSKFSFVRIIFKSFRARYLYNTNNNEVAPVRRDVHFPTRRHAVLPTVIGRWAGSNGVSPRVHTETILKFKKLAPNWNLHGYLHGNEFHQSEICVQVEEQQLMIIIIIIRIT